MHVEAEIRHFIAQNLLFSDEFPYEDDDSFLQQGIIDSVGVMELVLLVRETFGLAVHSTEITPDNFDSVNKLAGFIRYKLDSGGMNSLPQELAVER